VQLEMLQFQTMFQVVNIEKLQKKEKTKKKLLIIGFWL
jgi:hypothetical protein